MKILFNGNSTESEAKTLSLLLQEKGFDAGSHVATALNGTFVPKASRDSQAIADGDQVEVVAPMQGG